MFVSLYLEFKKKNVLKTVEKDLIVSNLRTLIYINILEREEDTFPLSSCEIKTVRLPERITSMVWQDDRTEANNEALKLLFN